MATMSNLKLTFEKRLYDFSFMIEIFGLEKLKCQNNIIHLELIVLCSLCVNFTDKRSKNAYYLAQKLNISQFEFQH